ncbi:MAG: helix-turn-helix domain-containing protein [Candidatus Omnitrophica bacterium]|nr:helix-turn-helix domain-containing protein [Candidatus Omnitrophota bacterium]
MRTIANLRWLRRRHRVKLTTLAKKSGVSFLEPSRIEQKKAEAPKELLEKLAEAVRKSAQN